MEEVGNDYVLMVEILLSVEGIVGNIGWGIWWSTLVSISYNYVLALLFYKRTIFHFGNMFSVLINAHRIFVLYSINLNSVCLFIYLIFLLNLNA